MQERARIGGGSTAVAALRAAGRRGTRAPGRRSPTLPEQPRAEEPLWDRGREAGEMFRLSPRYLAIGI